MTATDTATPPTRAPRWMKIVLALSLALNLAVAGLALGAFLKDGPRRGMPRDLSFGPFTEAFSADDRRALREAFRGGPQWRGVEAVAAEEPLPPLYPR